MIDDGLLSLLMWEKSESVVFVKDSKKRLSSCMNGLASAREHTFVCSSTICTSSSSTVPDILSDNESDVRKDIGRSNLA